MNASPVRIEADTHERGFIGRGVHIVSETMTEGATAQLVFPGKRPQDVLAAYERCLTDAGFDIRQRKMNGPTMFHQAILGSKAKAYLVRRIVPFGELTKAGNRLGAEAQIYPWGTATVLRVAVVPYMELMNRSEIFFVSQGVFEKIKDDEWSREKLYEVLNRMASLGFVAAAPVKA